ncbi:MAG: sulfite oxidase-like oxidoreductase [Planctomycetales bacterium]|nr:sulfite oxidase-like oxidoreductase [Planctomycetales bacterium]
MFDSDAEKYQTADPPKPENLASDVIVSPDTLREERIPPGQSRTRKWPVLDAHGTPRVDLTTWRLKVFGAVERPYELTLDEFRELPRVKVFADFHCVTRWSRLGNMWEGVATRTLLERAGVRPEAKFVVLHGYDYGWTTNLPLSDFLAEDALLTDLHDGQPIDADHGGPVRAMVPRLYAWKSAKWIRGIELSETDQPGYWEQGGYHLLGDPWTEQRFRDDEQWLRG